MPKPILLTLELQASICKYLRLGLNRKDSAECSGITERTLYYWLKQAKEQKEGPYKDFLDAIEKAKAEGKAHSLAEIQKVAMGGQELIEEKFIYDGEGKLKEHIVLKKHAPKQWQPHAWRLERIDPEQFGRKDKHEITGAEGGPIQVQLIEHKSLPEEK